MPRKKKIKENTEPVKQVSLEEENQLLRQKLAEQEKLSAAVPNDPAMSQYMNEMRDIQSKGRVESNTIKVKAFSDHKNISLWTAEGRRIGPMHPHNIKKVFEREWARGNRLSATQPTPQEVAAYKETDEYKQKMKAHKAKRAIKDKSRKKGEMERYLKIIAEQTGQNAEIMNKIFKPESAGSVR